MKIKNTGKVLLIAVCLMICFLFIGNNSIINLYPLHRNVEKKEQEIQRLHKEIDSLALEIKKLKNDTAYIEKIAREKLGMARKNEKVFKFVEEK